MAALVIVLAAGSAGGLTVDEARHLLLRTGFGAMPGEVAQLLPLTREQAVDLILSRVRTVPRTPLPDWADDYVAPPVPPKPQPLPVSVDQDALKDYQKSLQDYQDALRSYQDTMRQRSKDLLEWWYGEMIATDSPLTERMVLFWHGHFTSAMDKVGVPYFMLRQNLLLRTYALGNFRELVHRIARDPAMLIYLDGQGNLKTHANENFARELMELFTLGEGNYTEQDVRETARAFTGWRVDHATGRAVFDPRLHDDGLKTILGSTGHWDGDDAIDIILDQPEAPRFIVTELWRELVSPTPDPAQVQALADDFRASDYQLAPLLRSLLLCAAFWSTPARGAMVKSPVQLAIGTARLVGLDPSEAAQLAAAVAPMGEQLFDPPTVKGWPSGDAWLTSATLLARETAVRRLPNPVLAAAEAGLEEQTRGIAVLSALPDERRLDSLLLCIQPDRPVAAAAAAAPVGDTLRRILLNPLYQLM